MGRILDAARRVLDGAPTVRDDLSCLDVIEKGLGARAAAYVETGANETVLATIAAGSKSDVLSLGEWWRSNKDDATARRQRFVAREEPPDIALLSRYARVMEAARPQDVGSCCGTPHVPLALRLFFSQVVRGVRAVEIYPPRPEALEGRGLTIGPLEAVAAELGAGATDLADALYTPGEGWGGADPSLYRAATPVDAFLRADPHAVCAAARRMPAAGRSDLAYDLKQYGLASLPAYTDWLLAALGDGAKSVREVAQAALSDLPAAVLVPCAADLLTTGKVGQREAAARLLGRSGDPAAVDALRDARGTERAGRVLAAIDGALTADAAEASGAADDEHGYLAVTGERIAIPPLTTQPPAKGPPFGAADAAALRTAIEEANARDRAIVERMKREGHSVRPHPIPSSIAKDVEKAFAAGEPWRMPERARHVVGWNLRRWTTQMLARLPQEDALRLSMSLTNWLVLRDGEGLGAFAYQTMAREGSDLRRFEAAARDVRPRSGLERVGQAKRQPYEPSDLLRVVLTGGWYGDADALLDLPRDAVWPYVAERLDIVAEAFEPAGPGEVALDAREAIRLLTVLPALPARFLAPVLEVATGSQKTAREEAKRLLADVPGLTGQLVNMLSDGRQDARAGTARWLAERDDRAAIAPIWARLRKEKSVVARAAMLAALDAFGEDLSAVLGPDALLAEAERVMAKAKTDKLDWLGLDALPVARWRDGSAVPPVVLRHWIVEAVRLKDGGGNGLFALYLDRLDPQDAERFSTHLLDGWIAYDTAHPPEEEAVAYARANARQTYESHKRWMGEDWTEERAYAQLKAECTGTYLNSGAATKGLLALTIAAPPALLAERARRYLKEDGARTSQAMALLSALAATGDPVCLQVVVSAAERLKQKSVQALAGKLVARAAEARGWSEQELADRTVPTAGLGEDGTLPLPCGADGKPYAARLGEDGKLVLTNPNGKTVSSLPSGTDEATKAAKKTLGLARKTVKQVTSAQTARLFEAMCVERRWAPDDWHRDVSGHPIVRRLAERLVWVAEDGGEDVARTAFRPTPEGDLTNTEDEAVSLEGSARIRLAHSAVLPAEAEAAWRRHFDDYEVAPLFAQFGRPVLTLEEGRGATEIEDRKGWLTDVFTIRGAATRLGYERGEALDGGAFDAYLKPFGGAGLLARIGFTGSCLPEQNVPAAVTTLSFHRMRSAREGAVVPLAEVPPVLLSECWNDYRTVAAKGAFAEDWETRAGW